MFKYLILCFILIISNHINAQNENVGYGFRAGLSFSKIDGPSELGDNGEELEQNKMASGFHIGMALSYKLTDLFGIRGELLYSQRGTDYNYDGPGYFVLKGNTQPITILGTRKQTINVSNSYIDIPLTAYYKLGYFELSAGLNTGFLISSTGVGSIEFEGVSPISGAIVPFEVDLSHNYKSDDAGYASEVTNEITVDGKKYDLPEFLGAYYDFPTRDKDLYKTLDFGLMFGAAYYLNESLFLSAKYIYGLGDADRNEYDRSLKELDNGSPILRDDVNRSKAWQFSIGFSF